MRRGVMDKPRLVYVPREDATPEAELAALVTVYQFVLEHAEHKKAAETGNDGEGAGVGEET
jgi:hypothetical protein